MKVTQMVNPTTKQPAGRAAWNAAIEVAAQMADEASSGKGALWYPHDDGEEPNGGDVLDRLPRAIRELKRNTDV